MLTYGTSRVPGHADEETTIMAKVGGPPVLGIGHEGSEVLLDGVEVEAVEGSSIVEFTAERVADDIVLAQDVELEAVGPPVTVLGTAGGDVGHGTLLLGHVCFETGCAAILSNMF